MGNNMGAHAEGMGNYVFDLADKAAYELYRDDRINNLDVAQLSRNEIREVGVAVLKDFFEMKRQRLENKNNIDKIITEAIDSALNDRMDAEKIASYTLKILDENGVGINEFINALAKQLSFDFGDNPFINQNSQEMKLVNAIKNSSTFQSTVGEFDASDSGDAELIRPIMIMGAKVYRIGYGLMNEEDIKYLHDRGQDPEETIYFYGCSQQWYKSGEGRLTITEYVVNQIDNVIKNIKR
jgi:hypothetical protein